MEGLRQRSDAFRSTSREIALASLSRRDCRGKGRSREGDP